MKQLRLPIFTSKIKYYNLRIIPPDPVLGHVVDLKKQFESVYGKQPLSGSKPHITLASFKMNSKYQDSLIQVLGSLSHKETFKLDIGGIDVFERSRTLCLKVSNNEAMVALRKSIHSLHDNHLKGRLKLFRVSNTPHVTISKTPGKKMLYESLLHFQKQEYSGQIEVDHLTLVSRSKYRTWDWQHVVRLS